MEGSAAVIGTMMLPILGAADPAAAREPARQLGLAFQLTNFIRDVAEDLDRGRIYLPDDDLAEFGVTRADLHAAPRGGRPRADQGPDPVRGERAPASTTPPPRPGIPLLDARLAGLHPHRVPRSTAASSTRSPRPTTTSSRGGPRCPTGVAHRWPRLRSRRRRPPGTRPRHADRGGDAMRTAVVLFTRDLRVHDNPALAAACANAERVVPLFVLDPALPSLLANRARFLHQAWPTCASRCAAGAATWSIRHGDPVAETIAAGPRGRRRGHRDGRRRQRLRPAPGDAGCGGVRASTACRCGSSRASRWSTPGDAAPGRRRRPLQGLHAVPPGLADGAVARRGGHARARVTLPDGVGAGRAARPAGTATRRDAVDRRRDRGPAPAGDLAASTSGRTTTCTTTWRRTAPRG